MTFYFVLYCIFLFFMNLDLINWPELKLVSKLQLVSQFVRTVSPFSSSHSQQLKNEKKNLKQKKIDFQI